MVSLFLFSIALSFGFVSFFVCLLSIISFLFSILYFCANFGDVRFSVWCSRAASHIPHGSVILTLCTQSPTHLLILLTLSTDLTDFSSLFFVKFLYSTSVSVSFLSIVVFVTATVFSISLLSTTFSVFPFFCINSFLVVSSFPC